MRLQLKTGENCSPPPVYEPWFPETESQCATTILNSLKPPTFLATELALKDNSHNLLSILTLMIELGSNFVTDRQTDRQTESRIP